MSLDGRPANLLAERAVSLGAAAIVAALDHFLAGHEWARDRLVMHAGRRIRLGLETTLPWGLPDPVITAEITDRARLRVVVESDGAKPAVSLLVRPSFSAVSDFVDGGPAGLSRHLRLEGDVLLAAALGEIATHLRWDVAEDLSRLTGDLLAHRITEVAGTGFRTLGDSLRRLAGNTVRGLTVEAAVVVPQPEFHVLTDRLGGLEARLGSIEERLQSASRRV